MRIGSTFVTVLTLAALAGATSTAETTMTHSPATTEVRSAISSVLDAENAAWKAGDAEAFCEAATPDVVFTNVVGMFSVGHAPMVAQHAHIFSTIYQGSTLKQTITNLALVRPDVAIVDTLAELSGFKASAAGIRGGRRRAQDAAGAGHALGGRPLARRLVPQRAGEPGGRRRRTAEVAGEAR